MKTLSKSKSFYGTILAHFRKQYKDVAEITMIQLTADKKICGGEWIDSKGVINFGLSQDAIEEVIIKE